MQYRIIIILFIIYILLNSISKRESYKDGMTKDVSLNLKGIFCLMVIISHIAAKTGFEPVFSFSMNFGYFAVGGFLFISGYGLVKQKKNLKSIMNKLIMIILPFVIINFIYYFYYYFNGNDIGLINMLKSIISFYPTAHFTWYVVEIVILYTLFYLTRWLIKDNKIFIVIMFIEVFIYNVLTYRYGLLYSWWLSNYPFVVGMFVSIYYDKIKEFILKYYKKILFTVLIVFLFLLYYQFVIIKQFTTYKSILISQLCITLFPLIIYLFVQKNDIKSKFFFFIGKYSYEIYLIQGIPFLFFRSVHIYIQNDFVYTIVCLYCCVVFGIIFSKLDKYLYKIIKVR